MPTVTVRLRQPFPWQQRVRDARADGCRFFVEMCGRRAGKTASAITTSAEGLLRGERWGWFAPTYKLATEAWREMVQTLGPQLIKRADQTERRMELVNGAVWEVWTLDGGTTAGVQMPGRSREYDGIVVDEAGLVSALKQLWEGALRPTLAKSQGPAYFVGTPLGRRSDFSTLFDQARTDTTGEWFAIRVGTADNPLIPRAELESSRAEAERNGTLPLWEQEWLGIPADDGSNPIGLAAIRRAQADPATDSRGEPNPIAAVGIDLAQSVDYTALYALDVYGRWVHVERWQAPWSLTKRRLAAWLRRHCTSDGQTLTVPVCVDQSGVGSPIVGDLHAMGLAVQGVVFTASSRRSLLERLIVDVQAGRVSIPRPEHESGGFVVAELESLGTETLPSGAVRYAVPNGMHDDGLMALALACHAYRGVSVPPHETKRSRAEMDDRAARRRSRAVPVPQGPIYTTVDWQDQYSAARDGYESVDI